MAKEIYYTIENGEKKLTWIARDTETKEVVKEFTDMIEGLKFVNKNENTELYNRTAKDVFEFIRR
jgi:ribosomal protein L7Ae-like RNA K-turn-binding protein